MQWINAAQRRPQDFAEVVVRQISTKNVLSCNDVWLYGKETIQLDSSSARCGATIPMSDIEWLDEPENEQETGLKLQALLHQAQDKIVEATDIIRQYNKLLHESNKGKESYQG